MRWPIDHLRHLATHDTRVQQINSTSATGSFAKYGAVFRQPDFMPYLVVADTDKLISIRAGCACFRNKGTEMRRMGYPSGQIRW